MHITDNDLLGRVRIHTKRSGERCFVVASSQDDLEKRFATYIQNIATMIGDEIKACHLAPWTAFLVLSAYVSLSLQSRAIENFVLTDGKRIAAASYVALYREETKRVALHLLSLWNKGVLVMPAIYPYTLKETKNDFIK